jgi:outer membrane protein TolC
VPAAKAAVDAARANLAQAQGRYRSGVGSIIEVADAQSLLAQAQGDWVRATTSYHLAIASLQRALGTTGTERPLGPTGVQP